MRNLRQVFEYLNDISFPYVVLRNFENLPDSVVVGTHGDLDLLVYDLDHFLEVFPDVERVHPEPRVRFRMPIGDTNVYMDVRYVGDGYYPTHFETALLNSREKNPNGFYTPNASMFRIALAYHAVHHKNSNTYPRWLGDATIEQLLEALKASNVGWVEPHDKTVGRFNAYWRGATSVVEKTDKGVIKRQTAYSDYNLIENEARILSQVSSVHFPKVLKHTEDSIEIEDCGDPLSPQNLPEDWKEQLVSIGLALRASEVQHRDIKPDNLMVKDGVIKLIDWGWARLETDNSDNPPSCLGYPYRPSWGIDDNFSLKKIIKELEFAREELLCVS